MLNEERVSITLLLETSSNLKGQNLLGHVLDPSKHPGNEMDQRVVQSNGQTSFRVVLYGTYEWIKQITTWLKKGSVKY